MKSYRIPMLQVKSGNIDDVQMVDMVTLADHQAALAEKNKTLRDEFAMAALTGVK